MRIPNSYPGGLDDEALRTRLYPPAGRDSEHVQPDWGAVVGELKAPRKRRRRRLTRRQLWVEYRDEALARGGTAYSYSQFCARLKARLKDRAGPTQMRFDYAPGLYGLSDFSGNVGRGVDARVGERMVEVFLVRGGERLAVHPRKSGRNQYATMPRSSS